MKRTIKFTAAFIVLSCFLVFQSCKRVEEIQNNVLEYSLGTLGDKLFSLIGDSPEKRNLKEKYDAFVQRATNGEVDQERIEYVAANILNASNQQDSINTDQAANILETTETGYKPAWRDRDELSAKQEQIPEPQLMSIGENLANILTFNENLKKSYTDKYKNEEFAKKVFYKYDEGIELNLDEEIKAALDSDEFEKVFVHVRDWEKSHNLIWQKNLAESLQKERSKYRNEMKKLKELKFLDKDFMKEFNIEQFSLSDSNIFTPHIPDVNLDSILKSVEEELKAAGVSEFQFK